MKPGSIINKFWPEFRQDLLSMQVGGYYIEYDGWYTILCTDNWTTCDLPMEQTIPASGLQDLYDPAWVKDFEENFKPKLVRSSLGDDNA